MIVIQVNLAAVSIFSLAVACMAVAPACLGLILGVHPYSNREHLQVPVCLTAGFAMVLSLVQLSGVAWPYRWTQVVGAAITTIALAASGLYYLGENLRNPVTSQHWKLELAFVATWLLTLMFASMVTFFSLGSIWVATFGPDLETSDLENEVGSEKYAASTDTLSRLGGLGLLPDPMAALGLNGPPSAPLRPASPAPSWPSTLGSVGRPRSVGSLRSALDMRPRTPPLGPESNRNFMNELESPMGVATESKTSSPIKLPRSPLRVHLSTSSFSLKRSPSKASQKCANGPVAAKQAHGGIPLTPKHGKPSPTGSQSTMPSVDALHLGSLGIPSGVPGPATMVELDTQRKWVMIPNENSAESRSVSGSSQLTGRIFPAAEYNRKINAAGFEKDEPVPVNAHLLSKKKSFSQYDIERMHQQTRSH